MPLKVVCECDCQVSVPEHYAGRSIRCPMCKQPIVIPLTQVQPRDVDANKRQRSPVAKPPPQRAAANPLDDRAAALASQAIGPSGAAAHSTSVAVARVDTDRVATARWFAVALAVLACLQLTPALLAGVERTSPRLLESLPRWSSLLIFASLVQLAYAIYLLQLPDWSSAWTVTLLAMCIATAYALVLGLALLAPGRGPLIELLELDRPAYGRTLARWCFIMLCLTSLWSYYAGRFSIRWSRVESRHPRAS